MDDWEGLDLRGRMMLHYPWGEREQAFPMPGNQVRSVFGAFLSAGGSGEALCGLLNRHVPGSEYALAPPDLQDPGRRYSLEYFFYLFTFAQMLLSDRRFHYRIDDTTQLDVHHHILEQGPMKYAPWRYESDGPMTGYLSITNMRSMFAYVEEAVPAPPLVPGAERSEIGLRLSREALSYLNLCAPAPFRVERSFFNREEVLISFEYLFYISSIFGLLTNDDNFVYNSLYYGFLHSNRIARSIFLQPSIPPVEGFRQWQARTNNVYRLELRQRGRTLRVKLHLKKQIQTGMFGIYRESCVRGIRLACPAVYRAFMELATGKPVKASVRDNGDDPNSFFIMIRWKAPSLSRGTVLPALAGGIGALGLVLLLPELLPPAWFPPAMDIAASLAIGGLTAVAVAGRTRLRVVEKQFRETRKVIDEQYRSLKTSSEELLRERDTLELKVRQRTRELEEALERLKALDRAKTNFLANVSHELRTPLTLLSVPLEGIRLKRYGVSLPNGHPVFSLLERNVERLSNQINLLLDFSRLNLGTMPLAPGPIALVAYCRDLVAELESLAERKGLGLYLENRTGLDEVVIEADKALLETALLNLLNNALKFTERGSVRLIVEPVSGQESIRLIVQDTGIGFREEEKERLFERFTQAEDHKDIHHEGTGLGLALAREIAVKHRWLLDAESRPGEGSAFSLTIPLSSASAAQPRGGAPSDGSARRRRAASGLLFAEQSQDQREAADGRELILLVEDNPDMGTVLRNLLEGSYNISVCRSGEQALVVLRSGLPVDLIICDVMMPGMNGFSLRDRLVEHEEWRDLPFIFLTALADPADRWRGLESGALDYICKPFSGDELLLKVRNILAAQNARYRQALADGRSAERLLRLASGAKTGAEPPADAWLELGITPAERRVVELLRQGLQDKEIAGRLSLSTRTVSSHLRRLYQKTDTGNRVELLARLYRTSGG